MPPFVRWESQMNKCLKQNCIVNFHRRVLTGWAYRWNVGCFASARRPRGTRPGRREGAVSYRQSWSLAVIFGVFLKIESTYKWCLNRDSTLGRIILVHLTPGCWKETFDIACKVFFRYSWRNWLTRTSDLIRGRSTAVLFNIKKLVWSV